MECSQCYNIIYKNIKEYTKMNGKMRHVMVRAVMALVWIIVGVIQLVRHETATGIVSLAAGLAFGFSALGMMKKK